jgi:AAA domain
MMRSCYRPGAIMKNARGSTSSTKLFLLSTITTTTPAASSTILAPWTLVSSSNTSTTRSHRSFSSGMGTATGDNVVVIKSGGGHYQRPIFIAATRQHVGKTTVSLAMMSGLKKRFDKVGFIKPVGQQHVKVRSENQDAELRVDKDVCLVKEHFHLDHLEYVLRFFIRVYCFFDDILMIVLNRLCKTFQASNSLTRTRFFFFRSVLL